MHPAKMMRLVRRIDRSHGPGALYSSMKPGTGACATARPNVVLPTPTGPSGKTPARRIGQPVLNGIACHFPLAAKPDRICTAGVSVSA